MTETVSHAASQDNTFEQKLASLGFTLPAPAKSVASYQPYVVHNNQVTISGQLPISEGAIQFTGQVGTKVDTDTAIKAAQLCTLNLIAQLKAACKGNLSQVERCIRVGGFVNADSGFGDHPKIINGASDLLVAVFGDAGQHARAAVGCSSLPFNASVEIEATFRIKN